MFEPQASIAVPKHESAVDRFFEISKRGSTYKREILAGLTTFLVGAYIIFVNPTVLSLTGLPGLQGKGGPFIPLVAATCLTAGVMTLLMGLYGKYPLMMAPGMGLNAFVAYSLVATGKLTYSEAMGVILLEGVAITILVLTGLREALMNAIPLRLKLSIGVGIGLFIALIGFVDAGFVKVGVASAPIALGNLAQGSVAVAVFGLLLMAMLQVKKVKGSLLIGILVSTVFAIVLNAITGGQTFASVPGVAVVPTKVVALPDFSTLGLGLNVGVFAKIGVLAALLTILSVMLSDFFDTMGTVIAIGKQGKFLDESGNYPHGALKRILLVDSLGAAFGGLAGTSSNTTYIESAAGVSEGGQTGLASVVTGLLFLAAMFFAPLVGVIPAQATAPALIIVGFMMFNSSIFPIFQGLGEMDQGEAVAEGLSAFLAMVVMPFTYSITDGIGVGFITYTLLSLWFGKQVHWMMYVATAAFIVYFLSPV